MSEPGSETISNPTALAWSLVQTASRNAPEQASGGQTILAVCKDEHNAYELEQALRFFAPQSLPILHFPDLETLPYDVFAPHPDIASQRLAALYELPRLKQGIVITTAYGLLQRLPPREFIDGHVLFLKPGDVLNPVAMRQRLERAGYVSASEVSQHGEYALRGAILDLFPMGSDQAYRIELFDDEVESIRSFDPETQRSADKIDRIRLLPGREFTLTAESIEGFRRRYRENIAGDPSRSTIYERISKGLAPAGIEYYLPLFFDQTCGLWDYLPHQAQIHAPDLNTHLQHEAQEISERYEQRKADTTRPLLPPDQAFWPLDITQANLSRLPGCPPASIPESSPDLRQTENPAQALASLVDSDERRILITAESTGRREAVMDALKPTGLAPRIYASWHDFLSDSKQLGITLSTLATGINLNNPAISLITEFQLQRARPPVRKQKRRSRTPEQVLRDLTDLAEGAPVVHIDHGVGRYAGLKHIEHQGHSAEYVTLDYADGAKLYVPVTSLHLIHRYTGADADSAPVNKLGSDRWEKTRRKAAERARDVAAELLAIQARRAARKGHAFTIKQADYLRFCEGFPFTETEDQHQAIAAVLKDMTAAQSMDRVVCGDVGFGKTEVALRAAFVAASSGRQVCVLAPTTLLAQQHYRNFADRFADWPMNVELMSRGKTGKQQQSILSQLSDGRIDIVIGTHRLLSADIQFNNLGLIIVDEEHRFGVRQKERLKALRSEVDLLTLTATPIPRTLNMSLAGLRDLSLIATPPAERLAVKTFVGEWDSALIREACLREIKRGGQVYFLHNRVQDIERIARQVSEIVPEANMAIAHGQMSERELEDVMLDFYHNRINLLVCTTIVESGIDVPTANTIIMNRADKLGLAQMHQLRGRVGRSHHRAFAYLLIPSRSSLTRDAEQRLDAIAGLEELGAGFTLATHDMEIRGAGELLGEGQSGHIQEVGFSMYNDLLERAVQAIKSGRLDAMEPESGTEIELGEPALLPEDYVSDVHTRLVLYKRISEAADIRELDELKVELIDRFGLLPQQTERLFDAARLRQLGQQCGLKKLEAGPTGIRLIFPLQNGPDPAKVVKLIQSDPRRYRMDGPDKITLDCDLPDYEQRVTTAQTLLRQLQAD